MEKHEFVGNNFDMLKTLQRKERSLLGDLRVAYKDRDEKEFTKLLHRTGYKSTTLDYENQSKNVYAKFLVWQHFKTSRNLLFERDDDDCLFEEILKTPGAGNSKFITLIWMECELWRKCDVLENVNPKGKQPIDYVIESNDDENLFSFLVFDFDAESDSVTKASKKYFLKLKNDQYKKVTGESLFQKFYAIMDSECEDICFDIMKKLLKEMKKIIDIKSETAIDEVLKMQNEIYKHKILKLIMNYWKVYSKDYHRYKAILSDFSPYYKLFLTLKERREYEFEEFFPIYLELMKEKHGVRYESKVQKDCNSLLEFALINSQRKAINIIINCPLIDANKVSIKPDDSKFDSQNAHYIISKLLEKGYSMGYDDDNRVPSDWISAQVFEDFLDSRVTEDGIHGCQIDYTFLIDPEIRNENLKADSDNNRKLLFSKGLRPLENILNNERLKGSITHPVLSTFINLKSTKFCTIFYMNFYTFLCFFMIPFLLLVTAIPFNKIYRETFEQHGVPSLGKNNKIIYKIFGFSMAQVLRLPYQACIFATIYLTVRESFQLFFVSERILDYLKKKSNICEITIIGLSWTLLYAYLNWTLAEIKAFMAIPSAFIIIFATIELLSILPYPSMSIYMHLFKKVTITFMKFFLIFVLVIISFAISFCVILKPPTIQLSPWKQLRKQWNDYTAESNNTVPFAMFKEPAAMFVKTLESSLEGDTFRNFESPFTSFLKTLQMLSGEHSIEPYTLDSIPKQLLFLIFLLSSFVLFNLLNGLAISDIASLKVHAEFLNLKEQIRKAVESERVVCDLYWKISGSSKNLNASNNSEDSSPKVRELKWWQCLVTFFISLLVRKYPYLHKMDNLCVDFKQKTVKYEQSQKRFHILRTRYGKSTKYILNRETLEKLNNIIAKKQQREKSVNEKVESLQSEMKKLKISMRSQHEELKKLIQDCMISKKP